MQRYFIDQELDNQITINDESIIHHIKNVMRNKRDDEIGLINNGYSRIYKIDTITNDYVSVVFTSEQLIDPELKSNITVATPFLKKDNFELAISKMTECGVFEILPINYMRSVVKIDDKKWKKKHIRYSEIVKSAAMQSQRNLIPSIANPVALKDIDYNKYDLVITCYENEKNILISSLNNEITKSSNILIVIGPEGGLDDNEIKLLEDISKVVSLGNRILRSETAQIVSVNYVACILEGAL